MITDIRQYWRFTLIFFTRAFAAVLTILISYVVTKTLGIQESGLFFLANSMLMILSTFGCLGMRDSFVRLISGFSSDGDYAASGGIFKLGIIASFLVCLITSLILYFFSEILAEKIFKNPSTSSLIEIISCILIPFTILQLIGSAFQGRQQFLRSLFFKNISVNLIFFIAMVIAFYMSYEIDAVKSLKIFLYAALVTFSLGLTLWLKQNYSLEKQNFIVVSELKASAVPLWISSMMVICIEWFGILFSGAYFPPEEVALLAISQRLALSISFLLVIVNFVVAPMFASSYKSGNLSALRSTSLACSRVLVFCAIPIVFVFFIYADQILSLFGDEYKSAKHLLRILVIGQFVNLCCGSVANLLSMTGKEKYVRNAILTTGLLCIGTTIILVPVYGVIGAAIATCISVVIQNFIMIYYVKKHLGFNNLNLFRQ